MIHIFNCTGAICKLPCTLCKGVCDGLSECCKCFTDFWEPIIQNPLGNYVISTWVGMLIAGGAAGWGITQLDKCNEDLKGQLSLFCIADVALAFIHGGMAYYMQRAIIKGLGGKDYTQMSAKEIRDQVGQILLYDVPVCLYSFLACAAWGFNCWGLTLGSCGGTQPHFGAAAVMICWGILGSGYLFCWYCCQCCQGAVPKKKPNVPGTTVGASSA